MHETTIGVELYNLATNYEKFTISTGDWNYYKNAEFRKLVFGDDIDDIPCDDDNNNYNPEDFKPYCDNNLYLLLCFLFIHRMDVSFN